MQYLQEQIDAALDAVHKTANRSAHKAANDAHARMVRTNDPDERHEAERELSRANTKARGIAILRRMASRHAIPRHVAE